MIINKVRCWEFPVGNDENVVASFPEDNSGYDLVSCLVCGQVYTVSIVKEVYIGIKRMTAAKEKNCIKCGNELSKTLADYPEKYLSKNGEVLEWKRPTKYPEFQSVILEFPDLFSLG